MWKYCEICCVSITIYINEKKKYKQKTKKKTVTTVVTVLPATVATVRNLKKKKVSHQISTVDEQWKKWYEQCVKTVAA